MVGALREKLGPHIEARGCFYVRLFQDARADFSVKRLADRFRPIEQVLKPSILASDECRLFRGPGSQDASLVAGLTPLKGSRSTRLIPSNDSAFKNVTFWADPNMERGTAAWMVPHSYGIAGMLSECYDPIAIANLGGYIAAPAAQWLKAHTGSGERIGFALGPGVGDLFIFARGPTLDAALDSAFESCKRSPAYERLYVVA